MKHQSQLDYLVFDDENEEVKQNSIHVKPDGFTCNMIFVNPADFYVASTDRFDIDRFKEVIIEKTRGLHISLIATDWNMLQKTTNYPAVNGLQIVEIMMEINHKYAKAPFVIYSGHPSEASDVLISKIKDEVCNNRKEPISTSQLLSMLLELKIKFCERTDRFREIIYHIKSERTISTIVLGLLEKFSENMILKTGNDYYDGKSVGSIIELIQQKNTLGLNFIREFIELAIANYTELNDE